MKKGLIFNSYTNAYAIYIGARQLGITVYTTDTQPTFSIPVTTKTNESSDWLFFAEEASLLHALKGEMVGNFYPREFPIELLDDKWALANWLQARPLLTQGLRQWTIKEYQSVSILLPFPLLLKSKHSWRDGIKLPRGWVCHNKEEVMKRLQDVAQYLDGENVFFFQEWLGNQECSRVISVCGFYDYKYHCRNLSAIVERIASHNEGLSCSAAVQTIDDVWGLRERTSDILDALRFIGPYEMEFLVVGDRISVLELNPRFWMQHAIFLVKGNGLIKRYLEMDTDEDHLQQTVDNIVWIDTIHLFISLRYLRLNFLRLAIKKIMERNAITILWPSVPIALVVCTRMFKQKLKRKFGKFHI